VKSSEGNPAEEIFFFKLNVLFAGGKGYGHWAVRLFFATKFFHYPSLFHFRLKTVLFCKSFPSKPSFSSSGLTLWIPRGLLTDTFEHIRFLLFSFSAFPLFIC